MKLPRSSVAAVLIAFAALAVSVFSLMSREAPASPDEPATTLDAGIDYDGELRSLSSRVEKLEGEPATGVSAQIRTRSETGPDLGTDSKSNAIATDHRAEIQELTARLARLEMEFDKRRQEESGFADPNSIPAALAILLASRNVVIRVGDIDAIRANANVLADLVRDPKAKDWQRLEAYRGLLVFDLIEQATATLPALAALLESSQSTKVRGTAAGLMTNLMNPSVVTSLSRAYARERDDAVRSKIVDRLLQCIEDPTAQQILKAAQSTDSVANIRKKIARALASLSRKR